uniref:Uncharacterized protein n=1 Tax=Peronospora matthiolae TaxID=2874970 RepID=A0AAV1UL42_9STRA
MKLDDREVGGIYDTQVLNPEAVVHVTKDSDEIQIQHQKMGSQIWTNPWKMLKIRSQTWRWTMWILRQASVHNS